MEEQHSIVSGLLPLKTSLDEISPDPANVKKHPEKQIDELVAALRAFSQTQPLVVDKATRLILAGNGRYAAMRKLGWTHAAVLFVEWDATKGRTYQIVDNRIPEGGEWDKDALKAILPTLKQEDDALTSMLAGLGKELDAAIASLSEPEKPRAGSKKIPQPVIKAELVFDSDAQQQSWFSLLRKLRERFPQLNTHGARLEQLARELGYTA